MHAGRLSVEPIERGNVDGHDLVDGLAFEAVREYMGRGVL